MATHTYQIASYQIQLARENILGGGAIKFYAVVVCSSAAGDRFAIYFLRPDSGPANNIFNPSAKWATAFVPAEQYPWYADLLRNEKPLYARLNSDRPEWNTLSTTSEPVGEGGA